MKNTFIIKYYIFVFIIFSCSAQVPSLLADQEQEQERIVERVTVTNVEVPVRVLYKGEPVTDLTRDDFEIFENKKKMEIHGFFIKRKKIETTEKKEIEIKQGKPPLPRTFVFVFSITDFNEYIEKAVEHLFENILHKNDHLLIFANDKTMTHPNLEDKANIKNQLIKKLREESKKARRRLIKYINKIETYLNVHDFRVLLHRRDQPEIRLVSFLKKYLLTWNDYKKRYLTPRVDRFYYFSRYLEKLKSEKWVFNFYQFELFPKIKLTSRTMDRIRDISQLLISSRDATQHAIGKLMYMLLNQLYVDLNANKGFPTEEISKLFYKVDATFYSFFIKSISKAGLNDIEYEEVASDIERILKDITKITGGKNITSNNLVKSIKTVQEVEDVYYILTYVPDNPNKAGKLKIKVKNKKYKVFYDDNFRADYINEYFKKLEEKTLIPSLEIKDFSFEKKILSFIIVDYLIKEIDKKEIGRIKVRIKLTDENDIYLFDQAKQLTAQKKEMKISIKAFQRIKKGEYSLSIDAVDLFTGKESNFHKNIIVK